MKIRENKNYWYLLDSEGGVIMKINKETSLILRPDGSLASPIEKKRVIPIMFDYIERSFKKQNPLLARVR